MQEQIELGTFRELSTSEVARLVRRAGPKVCVFPINGTRRWYMLEHGLKQTKNTGRTYLDIAGRRHVELYRLLFDHGLDTLLTPVFGPDLLARGDDYVELAAEGLARLASHPDFVDFYHDYGVRVRFYGDYRKHLRATPYADLPQLFDQVTRETRHHERYRLFFGAFAHDATETVAELAVNYHARHGRVPSKRALVTMYFGEYVGPADLFIGFDKFCAFDMPLIATGNEDLYFTVSPSLYLTQSQLREILYDHLYARQEDVSDYAKVDAQNWSLMRSFYNANLANTLGVGARRNGFWHPLPQVKLPSELID